MAVLPILPQISRSVPRDMSLMPPRKLIRPKSKNKRHDSNKKIDVLDQDAMSYVSVLSVHLILQTSFSQEIREEVKHFADLPISEQTKKGHFDYHPNFIRSQLACRTEKGFFCGNDGYPS